MGYSPRGRKESEMTERLSLSGKKAGSSDSRTLPAAHGRRYTGTQTALRQPKELAVRSQISTQ